MPKKPKNITAKRVQATEKKPVIQAIVFKPEDDEGEWGEDNLNTRQRDFAIAYVGPAGGNASKAAEMAGYAAENRNALAAQASRLLGNVNVHEYICRLLAKRRASPDWVRDRLTAIASSSMANFISIDEHGRVAIDMKKAAQGVALGQIKEFTADTLPDNGNGPEIIKFKIKIADPTAALGILARVHKLIDGDDDAGPEKVIRVRRVKKSDASH